MTVAVGTRVELLEVQHDMFGFQHPVGTKGTVIPMEGEIAEYQWSPEEFAVRWDDEPESDDPGWFYYTPAERGKKWRLADE